MKRHVHLVLAAALALLAPSGAGAESAPTLDTTMVNDFDRLVMMPWSEPLDRLGTGLQLAAMVSPAWLLTAPEDEWLQVGVMYAESMILAWAGKELLKSLIDRPRPYMYFDGYPAESLEDGDWKDAFPSGHSTLAFAGAGFSTWMALTGTGDPKLRVPFLAATWTLAAATAASRVASGNHHMTDVLAGALLGTACGMVVPMVHQALGLRY